MAIVIFILSLKVYDEVFSGIAEDLICRDQDICRSLLKEFLESCICDLFPGWSSPC